MSFVKAHNTENPSEVFRQCKCYWHNR